MGLISPWLGDHVTRYMATHATELGHGRAGGKLQLISSSWFDPENPKPLLWAVMSDGRFQVNVAFTKECIQKYQENSALRFTELTWGILKVDLYEFIVDKPFVYNPHSDPKWQYTEKPRVALKVREFKVFQDTGHETIYTTPNKQLFDFQDGEGVKGMEEWIHALKKQHAIRNPAEEVPCDDIRNEEPNFLATRAKAQAVGEGTISLNESPVMKARKFPVQASTLDELRKIVKVHQSVETISTPVARPEQIHQADNSIEEKSVIAPESTAAETQQNSSENLSASTNSGPSQTISDSLPPTAAQRQPTASLATVAPQPPSTQEWVQPPLVSQVSGQPTAGQRSRTSTNSATQKSISTQPETRETRCASLEPTSTDLEAAPFPTHDSLEPDSPNSAISLTRKRRREESDSDSETSEPEMEREISYASSSSDVLPQFEREESLESKVEHEPELSGVESEVDVEINEEERENVFNPVTETAHSPRLDTKTISTIKTNRQQPDEPMKFGHETPGHAEFVIQQKVAIDSGFAGSNVKPIQITYKTKPRTKKSRPSKKFSLSSTPSEISQVSNHASQFPEKGATELFEEKEMNSSPVRSAAARSSQRSSNKTCCSQETEINGWKLPELPPVDKRTRMSKSKETVSEWYQRQLQARGMKIAREDG